MLDAITIGELLVDFIPKEKDLSKYPDFRTNAGGAPANVAVGCSKLGLESGFIGKVGDDIFGKTLKRTLKERGVDTSNLKLEREADTRIGIVSIEDGEWSEYFYGNPYADELLREGEINRELLTSSKLLHFGTISMVEEPSRSATLKAVEIADENDLTISLDPNLRINLWENEENPREMFGKVIDKVDILKLNENELEFFFGGEMEATVNKLIQNTDWVLVTRGEKGCYYSDGEAEGYRETYDAEMIDETGAGDGFMAGTIHGYLNDWDLEKTTDFASAAAALTIEGIGVIPSLPTKEEVLQFME